MARLNKSEFIQYIKNMISVYEQNNVNSPLLRKTLEELIELTKTLYKSHLSSSKHQLTSELEDCNKKRLKALRSLKKMLEIFLKEDDVEIRNIAQILYDEFTPHFEIILKSNRPGKTAAITTLATKWKESPIQNEGLNSLGLTVWLDKLILQNQKFDETYVKRVNTTVKKVSMTQKRAEITPVCLKLIKETEAFAIMNPEDMEVLNLIEKVNILCNKFTNLIRLREANTDINSVEETLPTDELGGN